MARRKKRKFKMPSTEFFLKLAGGAALLLGFYWLLDDYYEEEAEMRRVEREQDRARGRRSGVPTRSLTSGAGSRIRSGRTTSIASR